MLAFWDRNEALTVAAADCANLSKRSRCSGRAASNSNVIVTKPLFL